MHLTKYYIRVYSLVVHGSNLLCLAEGEGEVEQVCMVAIKSVQPHTRLCMYTITVFIVGV